MNMNQMTQRERDLRTVITCLTNRETWRGKGNWVLVPFDKDDMFSMTFIQSAQAAYGQKSVEMSIPHMGRNVVAFNPVDFVDTVEVQND